MTFDFAKAISAAQQRPESLPTVPDPFAPLAPDATPVVSDVPHAGGVPGVTGYALEYHCERFYVGKELIAIGEEGGKTFQDRDESGALKEVMDRCLKGDGVIFNRKESILQDGSVVVWMEWGEPRPKKAKEPGVLTAEELRSPKRVTERSRELDGEAAAEAAGTDGAEELENSPEDEPDW